MTMTNEKMMELAIKAIKPTVEDPDRPWECTYVAPNTQPKWGIDDFTFDQFVNTAELVEDSDGYITFLVKEVPIYYPTGQYEMNCYFDFIETEDGLELFRICPIESDDYFGNEDEE